MKKEALIQRIEDVLKSKIYLAPGDKLPAGVQTFHGSRGGIYYESRGLSRQEAGKIGGLATKGKYGKEYFKKIGKVGFKVTTTKIMDMIANPDKYGVTNEDIWGIARFLKKRLNMTVDTYRNQFSRAWHAGLKDVLLKHGAEREAGKQELLRKVTQQVFGEQHLEKNFSTEKQTRAELENQQEEHEVEINHEPFYKDKNLKEKLLGDIEHFLEKARKYERQPGLVPKRVVEEVHRGGKVFPRERIIMVRPEETGKLIEAPKLEELEVKNKLFQNFQDAKKRWHDLVIEHVKGSDLLERRRKAQKGLIIIQDIDAFKKEIADFRAQHGNFPLAIIMENINKMLKEARARQRQLREKVRGGKIVDKPEELGIEKTPLEKSLESDEITSDMNLGGGCNVARIVKFKDRNRGIFKPVSGEQKKLREGIEAGTYYKREVAAYQLCKFLGWNYVPETVIREHRGEMGSLQLFAENASEDNINMIKNPNQIEECALFNMMIGNLDRHGGNWLLSQNGEPVLIDHGLSFPSREENFRSKFVDKVNGKTIPQNLLEKVNNLKSKSESVERILNHFIEPKAIKLFWERIDRLLERKKFEEPW